MCSDFFYWSCIFFISYKSFFKNRKTKNIEKKKGRPSCTAARPSNQPAWPAQAYCGVTMTSAYTGSRRGGGEHGGAARRRGGTRAGARPTRTEAGYPGAAAPPLLGRRSVAGVARMRRRPAGTAAAIPAAAQRVGTRSTARRWRERRRTFPLGRMCAGRSVEAGACVGSGAAVGRRAGERGREGRFCRIFTKQSACFPEFAVRSLVSRCRGLRVRFSFL